MSNAEILYGKGRRDNIMITLARSCSVTISEGEKESPYTETMGHPSIKAR